MKARICSASTRGMQGALGVIRMSIQFPFHCLLISCLFPGVALGTPITEILDGIKLQPTIQTVPVQAIRETRVIDGILYTIGQGEDGRAIAHQQDLTTGESSSIPLQNVTDSGLGDGFAYSIAQVGNEIRFAGVGREFIEPGGFAAMTWDSEGNPTRAAFLTDLEYVSGVIRDVNDAGFMTGSQSSTTAVMWNSIGEVFELPRTELSDILGMGSSGIAMTNDATIIVGDIGGAAAAWEAVGDPMNGQYALKEYGFDDVFPYTMEQGLDGFAPNAAQFILETEAFGVISFSAYHSPEGIRSGAWSVEDGSFIRDFGFGRIQDVLQIGDEIIVATSKGEWDNYSSSIEVPTRLWSFTDPEPLNLRDLTAEYGFHEPYFTRGGLFQTENGFGALLELEQSGSSTHVLVEFTLQDSISGFLGELEFSFGGASTQVASVNSFGMGNMPIYHEWQEVAGQVLFTVGQDLPPGPIDVSFQVTANGVSWLANPEVVESLGESLEWDVQTDGDKEIATFTLNGVDLSGYEAGDRVAIATIAYRPNPNNPVGIPSNVSGGYAEPTSAHGISLTQAQVNGGQEISFQSEVSGQFVPVIYDVDDNGRVGLSDFVQFIQHYGQVPGPEYPNAYRFDFNRDGRVGLSDFVLFIQHFGATQSSGRSIYMPGFEVPTPPPIMEAEPLSITESEQAVPGGTGLLEGEPLRGQGLAWEMGYVGYTVDKSEASPSGVASADVDLSPAFVSRRLDERLVDAVLESEDFSELLAGNENELEYLDFDFDFLAEE